MRDLFFLFVAIILPLLTFAAPTPTATIAGRSTPVLALRAASSAADSCPTKEERCKQKCFSKGYYRHRETCECIACPVDDKAKADWSGCEPDTDYQKKKGQCSYGNVLDLAEGGQDQTTQKPVCVPDDSSLCRDEGTVPKSRDKSDKELLDETTCAPDVPEENKPKCKSNEYAFMQVWEADGGATKTAEYKCEKTRKFGRDKNTKLDEVKEKKKSDYAERKKQKDEDDRKFKEEMQKQEDESRENRKKSRMGQCLICVALSLYTDDTLVDYAVDYFDEDFVSSSALMAYWPSDMPDIPEDGLNIDTEEYMQLFVDAVSDAAWWTNRIGPGKRSDMSNLPPATTTDIISYDSLAPHEKRWVAAVVGAITAFLTRLAPLLARVGAGAARLRKLIDKGGARLAKSGQGKKSKEDQDTAAKSMSKDKNWDNCLKGKKPEKQG